MPEAVIVATARSPIGRANKGSLVDVRPDDLAATIVRAALGKVPAARPRRDRGRDHGLRAARRRAGLQPRARRRAAGRHATSPARPSTATARRACRPSGWPRTRSSAGEGDVFVAAGVECVSRFDKGRSDGGPGTTNDLFSDARARTKAPPGRGRPDVDAGRRPARRLHRDGPDRGERRPAGGRDPRGDGRVRGAVAAAGPSSRRRTASSSGRSSRSRCPTAR